MVSFTDTRQRRATGSTLCHATANGLFTYATFYQRHSHELHPGRQTLSPEQRPTEGCYPSTDKLMDAKCKRRLCIPIERGSGACVRCPRSWEFHHCGTNKKEYLVYSIKRRKCEFCAFILGNSFKSKRPRVEMLGSSYFAFNKRMTVINNYKLCCKDKINPQQPPREEQD